MARKRQLPANAEVAVYRTTEPILINGGQTVKSLSAAFLADLEQHWRTHKQRVGPEGRKLFEKFLRDVNKLQMEQLAAQEHEDRNVCQAGEARALAAGRDA
jgi:hypothetical protein